MEKKGSLHYFPANNKKKEISQETILIVLVQIQMNKYCFQIMKII